MDWSSFGIKWRTRQFFIGAPVYDRFNNLPVNDCLSADHNRNTNDIFFKHETRNTIHH